MIYGTLTEAFFNGVPPSAKELGAAANGRNDTGNGRWLDAEYRNGKLWATRNTACNFGDGEAESCLDWIARNVKTAVAQVQSLQKAGA